MANRYWVGGTGTWDNSSTANWSTSSGGASGASVPTTSDAIIFDANSNTGTNDFTVTLSGAGSRGCLTLNTTGIDPANAMTIAGTTSLTVTGTTFTLTNKVLWTNTGTITFNTTSTCNVTTAGVSIASSINQSSGTGTINFVDAFTCTGNLQIQGTATSTGSNKTITCASFQPFSCTINTGASSTINITGNNTTVLNASSTIVYTSPSALNFTYSGSTGTRTITSKNIIGINVTAGSDSVSFNNNDNWGTTNFTGFNGTLATAGNNLTISGSFTTPAAITVTGNGPLTFDTTGTITTNGASYGTCGITIDGASQTITLNGNLSCGGFTLTKGTFNAVTYNVTATSLSSSNTNTRTLGLGSGTWTITGSGNAAWQCPTTTNLTITGTAKISMSSASSKSFQGGGATWPILEQAGAGALTVTGSNTFTTIQNSVQPTTFTFTAGTTQTITNWSVNGTAGNLVTIQSSSAGSAATLSKSSGTVSSDYLSIKDSTATGGATWYAGANSTNVSGNTGWIFTAPPGPNSGNFFFMFGA